ncbi:Lysosome-associated membrane glycoprotein 5 [Branchiostoma belcheri]|nr:Lysosome-associated membrane glycoprotein 5 [Branchiostoma belcheri]
MAPVNGSPQGGTVANLPPAPGSRHLATFLHHRNPDAPGTDIFSAPISHSYKCSSRLQVDMTAPDGEEATLVLQDTQIQPFHLGKNGNYGTRRECGADHYGDVIPLAVGLGLGALILLMIVAYYFHRRYQGPPYENM